MTEFYNHTVGAYEAKTHLPELLRMVEGGEEFTITKHGTPVAKIIPVGKKAKTNKKRGARIDRWLASKRPTLGALRAKDLITEGRK